MCEHENQLSHEIYLLVSCLITISTAIRVDWNTNKGPIIPPTVKPTVQPQPPYREPAPVWEDQSGDIPNPNPYVYVLPPPSRPRPNNNNYYFNSNTYGNIVAPSNANSYQQTSQTNQVSGLAPQYVPNVGLKYFAVVPNASSNNNNNNNKINGSKATKYASSVSANGLSSGYFGDKVQGKYNPKTKKYKAYEKVKYVPLNYNPLLEFVLPNTQKYDPVFDQQYLIQTQQLPFETAPQPFRAPVETVTQQTAETRKPFVASKVLDKTTTPEKSQKKPAADKTKNSNLNAVGTSKSS
ncbi:homeobox protein 4 [Teleopsis dalmanni]|uniref:homeobox protein 4 n=1 Tax=Teleopsis dalmanni TaxID=139649 RepID=UPI0018CD5A61|nr:homeobox protein 4 [Teleopsis dalmanni]